MTKSKLSNPIKQIAKVLNYARKHKIPEQRSALTYWEEDYPSSIDLGKEKYGGPFTVEDVEDVKTVLRLVPVVVCITMGALGLQRMNYDYADQKKNVQCYNGGSDKKFEQTIIWLYAYPVIQRGCGGRPCDIDTEYMRQRRFLAMLYPQIGPCVLIPVQTLRCAQPLA